MRGSIVEAKIDRFHVPGGYLHYEVRGRGPLLLFIAGANGSARPFEDTANLLAARFKCLTYDRRGFGRSSDDPAPDPAGRLALDSDDARRLIEREGDGTAYVLGSSSGAVVALDLMSRCSSMIERVVAHEPPYTALVSDGAQWQRFFDDVYEEYRKTDAAAAVTKFLRGMQLTGGTAEASATVPTPELRAERLRGTIHWLEHEVRQYTRVIPDIDQLAVVAERVVLAGGVDSHDKFLYQPNVALGARIGRPVIDFPGGHVGYVTHPVEFAARLAEVLG